MELTKHILRTEKWSSTLSIHLCEKHYYEFDKWWDPEKFNWRESWTLTQYCHMYFDIWWDTEKYNWKDASWALAKYCYKHFDKWWNKEMFNWKNGLRTLVEYCYTYAQVWLPAYIKSANLTKALLHVNYEVLLLECILD